MTPAFINTGHIFLFHCFNQVISVQLLLSITVNSPVVSFCFSKTKSSESSRLYHYCLNTYSFLCIANFLFQPQTPLSIYSLSDENLSRLSLIQNITIHKEDPCCQMLSSNYSWFTEEKNNSKDVSRITITKSTTRS